ncbi:putative bifunctional diguanylate cyclase/phosphodiesterase [Phytohabitans rumicis]|uniref:GGDEF-domain containing protein n=1 Tax=Phytohabitans rumicis TaxID=1076125 RepID=A0A6V8L7C1_9ACTN|nr:EAL domain-containing protein [Phytohabitans rumicis]GFJ93152.1 hypothetical protein Prum_067940 [Phytohabitans rumicis]
MVETRQRNLLLLTGLLGTAAAGSLGWAAIHAGPVHRAQIPLLLAATTTIALGNACSAQLRVRTQARLSFTSAAILVTATAVPIGWLILCTACGVAIAKAVTRYPVARQLHKAVHNTAKDIVGAAAVGLAMVQAGVAPSVDGPHIAVATWPQYAAALICGAAAFAVVEEAVTPAAVAAATGRSWWQVLRTDLDVRIMCRAVALGIAMGMVALLMINRQWPFALPLVTLAMYVVYKHRLHVLTERRAWEQVAATTDELNSAPDLTSIIHTAARGASALFVASCVEVELWGMGPARLVRITGTQVVHDGPPPAPADLPQGYVANCAIDSRTVGPIGVIRLYLDGQDRLSNRERSMLRALGVALATALTNAGAFVGLLEQAHHAETQARRDALTGLSNRRELLDQLNHLLARGHLGSPALAMVDLDKFKEINDSFGHAIGDQLIVDVAQRLASAAQARGALVARLGGDEFAILFKTVPAEATAIALAERVIRCLDTPLDVSGLSIIIKASVGVALAEPGTSGAELLHRADHAMYRAKRGKVTVALYRHERDNGVFHLRTLAADLGNAAEAGQISVHVQPIVHLGTGQVVACEAIPRWDHPQHGTIEPAAWLDLIERSDHLAMITGKIVDLALAAARQWQAAGVRLPVAVNISQRCLLDVHLPHMVLGRLQIHGLEPSSLVLELTETAGISKLEAVDRAVAALRNAGVRLTVDNFGTGPSSLSVATRVPLDGLKVDAAIIDGLLSSQNAALVVRAATQLSQDLGIGVGAEGVSTDEQRRLLWDMGCITGQGDLFGPPEDVATMVDALRDGRDGTFVRLAQPITSGPTAVPLGHAN